MLSQSFHNLIPQILTVMKRHVAFVPEASERASVLYRGVEVQVGCGPPRQEHRRKIASERLVPGLQAPLDSCLLLGCAKFVNRA